MGLGVRLLSCALLPHYSRGLLLLHRTLCGLGCAHSLALAAHLLRTSSIPVASMAGAWLGYECRLYIRLVRTPHQRLSMGHRAAHMHQMQHTAQATAK